MPIPSEPSSKTSTDASSVRDNAESHGTVINADSARTPSQQAEPTSVGRASEFGTGFAPSFPDPGVTVESDRVSKRPEEKDLPVVGDRIEDFELLRELGRGAMGVVFLARQSSLERQVALKVCYNAGNEARTMAVLEHRHVVQVFSELIVPQTRLHLICMQYVAGTTLASVIQTLAREGRHAVDGNSLLAVVDSARSQPAVLDLMALRDRDLLARCDPIEATCWIGARLAEALGYAHRQGVLHRDIKPANVLLDQYGCPRLADFSLSTRGLLDESSHGSVFGGTLAYMSPEHLEAFRSDDRKSSTTVDERSDVYALGVVLFELLTLRLPFASPPSTAKGVERFDHLAAERRQEIPRPTAGIVSDNASPLDHVIRRCLAPDPAARFPDADSLARALDGCRELHRRHRHLPPPGFFTRVALRHPFPFAVSAAILPHLIGTAVNIAYNAQFIVSALTTDQQRTFLWLVLIYNSIAYTIGISGQVYTTLPVWLAWPGRTKNVVGEDELVAARRLVLQWPVWAAGIACVCWLPGGLFFPWMLNFLCGPVPSLVFWHFMISFALSGLISMTYSMAGIQYLALRVYYPQLWHNTDRFAEVTRSELHTIDARLRLIQTLSGLIPLVGAALVVMAQPEHQLFDKKNMFQILAVGLIAMGMAGFQLAVTACDAIRRTISALLWGQTPGTGTP